LIEQLPSAIHFALANETARFYVFEEPTRLLAAAMGVFVSDDFVQKLKTTPLFWVGPELVTRIIAGKSPLLSPAEVRDANSAVGLNWVVWHFTCHPGDFFGEIMMLAMTRFDQDHRGLRFREVIGQADCLEHYNGMRNGGGLYFDRFRGAYGNYPELNAGNFPDEPRNCGLTRDLAVTQPSSWLGSLIVSYAPPRLGLTRSEQRLLLAARDGQTDKQLSDRLGISIHVVKRRWRMIYDRAACLPDLLGLRMEAEARGRGEEKKQRILDYVRKHPEELHPVSRKLLK